MADRTGPTVTVGPYSYGLTLLLNDDVTVYVGMPPPEGAENMKQSDAVRIAKHSAVRMLEAAIQSLVYDFALDEGA